jgi:hypothetical protein
VLTQRPGVNRGSTGEPSVVHAAPGSAAGAGAGGAV